MRLDPKTTAFVFPGQGSQAVGMGKDLAAIYPVAKQTFDQADSILGFFLSKIMWEGPESDLNETINTQPALFVHSLAAYRTFLSLHPEFMPAISAGHSLGELSALTASGAFSFDTGLQLVRKRGELMKHAGELAPGSMAAILGLDIPTLDGICKQASLEDQIVQVANDNCPGQVVISGAKPAVERALAAAKAAGARRALPLAVSIAAHSPLMASIQNEWEAAVRAAPFGKINVPVIGNVHAARLPDPESARVDLIAQMQSRVRWTESVHTMMAEHVRTFVEVGSGTVLTGLVKRISSEPGVVGLTLGTPGDFISLSEE